MRLRPSSWLVFASPLLALSASHATCINGGTSSTIQTALNSTGIAELCQSSSFNINAVISIPANGKIFTTGYPTSDSLKASLQASANLGSPLIQAYSSANVEVRNIKIDGNRASLGYIYSQALIAISGNNSVLDHVRGTNTAGLAAIAASDNPNCSGLQITNNYVGTNGFHTGSGSPWANGIDFRCNNAYVAHNEVRDATDGAISFYGGTNTVIEENWIANSGASAYSGIIAADLYGASFTGSVVQNNLIETCCGQHLHIALSIGTHSWCDDTNPTGDCQNASGVSFLNNTGSGTYGIGIAVDGMYDATVTGNNLTMTQWTGMNCYVTNQNWYVRNVAHSSGTFQSGYSNRAIHWPCLTGH